MTDEAKDWPKSSLPNTAEWAERGFAHFLLCDLGLDLADARALADDMSIELWCRTLSPEAAVDMVFRGWHGEIAPA